MMTADLHTLCQRMIDDRLVTKPSLEGEPLLREHLRSCTLCQEYLDASTRVIASLGSFTFEVDPSLPSKVSAALQVRAEQLKAPPPDRRRLVRGCMIAIFCAAAGSLLDLQCGDLVASLLHLSRPEVRQALLTFWVLPALIPLILFPILPLVASRKERLA